MNKDQPEQICILCGQDLDKYETNKEHYIHAVVIRNFDKLKVPKAPYALRVNRYLSNEIRLGKAKTIEKILTPIENNKIWATVLTHQRCNSDSSKVGVDFKYIIDNLDNHIDSGRFYNIIEYYANLWKVNPESITIEIKDINELSDPVSLIYQPGFLNLGRIRIYSHKAYCSALNNDQQYHTIYFGEKSDLERL